MGGGGAVAPKTNKQSALKEYTYNSHCLPLYVKAPENIQVHLAQKQILTTSVTM